MIQAFSNILKIPELKKKLLVTVALLAVYCFGRYIPTPGIDGHALSQFIEQESKRSGGSIFDIMDLFTGNAMSQMTIFAFGIMPYISSSIIMQLLTFAFPYFEKLAKEGGEHGRRMITQYTRYGTLVIGAIQALFTSFWLENLHNTIGIQVVQHPGWGFRLMVILTLVSGTAFIMWLGEQITEFGIGNGMSIIITASIISRIPTASSNLYALVTSKQIDILSIIMMAAMLFGVIVAVIMITQAQRRIPVQYAKRIVGRKVMGGQSTYLPLRVNQAGVIPIIFAQSILMFPAMIAQFMPNQTIKNLLHFMSTEGFVHYTLYAALIIFFTYFYTAVTLNPRDLADNMKKYGGFVPGVRPGKPTEDYFNFILNRVTLPGAVFLAIIAIIPYFVGKWLKIPYLVASFFGGTALLIIVGVMLDTMKQIESFLLMRHYDGFMKSGRLKARGR
ncbi:MAG: preprotein translocase subunit SecY [Candidatus Omnitrophica bacterium]|jgi:preprotein translocase subunit SecY|nr:preprotein translocase subunit SecY [Candidatus Omnitrophota bacterium]